MICGLAPQSRATLLALAAPIQVALLLALSSSVVAAPAIVVLLQPSSASPGVRRCLTRIRNELMAGGLVVAVADRSAADDPFSVAEAVNRERGERRSNATIALLGDPDVGPVELWIVDRIVNPGAVHRIVAPTDDPSRIPEILAVRALEALRASALALLVESNRPPVVPMNPAMVGEPPADGPLPPAGGGRVGVETGLSMLESAGGPGLAVMPLVRMRLRSAGAPFLRLGLAGLGRQPRVGAAQGSARVDHGLALIEGGAWFRPQRSLHPVVSVGAGILRVSVDGDGLWPYQSSGGERWSALFDVGAGFAAPVAPRLSLSLEVHGVWAAPHPVVRFAGVDSATVARPGVFVALSLIAWL
jgi:hypothetical protein